MKSVLLIAFEYPPGKGAGVERPLSLSNYLPEFGWKPIVLTVKPTAYDFIDESRTIPSCVSENLYRAFSFNAARDFSFKGKYLKILSAPDRWSTWFFDGYFKGRDIIKKHRPEIVWSTYPIATSHAIALALKKTYGIRWVADYRDPMSFHYKPSNDSSISKYIDRETIKNSDSVTFVTDHMKKLYSDKYEIYKNKFNVIENGFNDEYFNGLEPDKNDNRGIFKILHSGAIYENGRNPKIVFEALKILKNQQKISNESFRLLFRGARAPEKYIQYAANVNVLDLVEFLPSIDYRNSLIEMLSVDALLVIQGEIYNNQIPGKVYEYLRAKKPIISNSPVNSAVGQFVSRFDFCFVCDTPQTVASSIDEVISRTFNYDYEISEFSRRTKAKQFADLFNSLSESSS